MKVFANFLKMLMNTKKKLNILYKFILLFSFNGYSAEISNILKAPINFVDRRIEIDVMDKILDKNKNILVYGLGGIGKTYLVNRYSNVKKDKYDVIWYIDDRC
jgi:hypothetical protein